MISTDLAFHDVNDLSLDPKNPRLGRHITTKSKTQGQLQKVLEDQNIGELITSFGQNGFWPQEALLVLPKEDGSAIVVEGNRRLAALKVLAEYVRDDVTPKRWKKLLDEIDKAKITWLDKIPCIEIGSREQVAAYLGFRHVTGIKEWSPAEKAEFIAHMIEDQKLGYTEVMRAIGSKTPTVRQNYISYRLLSQIEDNFEDIDVDKIESRFSVLFLSLRTKGVQSFLGIDVQADVKSAKTPVPRDKLDNIPDFAKWMFGDANHEPLFLDSRATDRFGVILESDAAVEYLRRHESPSFEKAFMIAGGEASETALGLERASDNIEESLQTLHLHKDDERVVDAAKRLIANSDQVRSVILPS